MITIKVTKMETIGKKSKFKLHLLNEMGNAVKCIYFKSEIELNRGMYDLDDNQLFKAYIGGGLYCWHKKLG